MNLRMDDDTTTRLIGGKNCFFFGTVFVFGYRFFCGLLVISGYLMKACQSGT